MPVRLAPVQRTAMPRTIEVVGTLFGDEEATIAAKTSGRVLDIQADLGDRVEDAQPLASIDPTDYRLEVERRELALAELLAKLGLAELPVGTFDVAVVPTVRRAALQSANAAARLARARQLFERDPPLMSPQDFADIETQAQVSKQDLDVAMLEARAILAQARSRAAELAVARQTLSDTVVRAPQGTGERPRRWAVAERLVSVGEFVQPGRAMYRLIVDDPIKWRVAVPERFVGQVRPGQSANLRVESASADGTVFRVSPAVDVDSRTFAVEILVANAGRALKPGGFARGTITIGELPDMAVVPPEAMITFAGITRVFSVRDGKAQAHEVNVIQRDDRRVVLDGPLDGVREVVVGGLARLANGVPVTLDSASTAPASARSREEQ